jgi:hypothetical protein
MFKDRTALKCEVKIFYLTDKFFLTLSRKILSRVGNIVKLVEIMNKSLNKSKSEVKKFVFTWSQKYPCSYNLYIMNKANTVKQSV